MSRTLTPLPVVARAVPQLDTLRDCIEFVRATIGGDPDIMAGSLTRVLAADSIDPLRWMEVIAIAGKGWYLEMIDLHTIVGLAAEDAYPIVSEVVLRVRDTARRVVN